MDGCLYKYVYITFMIIIVYLMLSKLPCTMLYMLVNIDNMYGAKTKNIKHSKNFGYVFYISLK